MYIKTQRLLIRNFKTDDLNDVFNIYKDDETCKYLLHDAWNENNKNQEFKLKLSKANLEKDYAVNLACVFDNVVIGDINIWYTQMKDSVEIGYTFNPKYSNNGYATEALKTIVEYLLTQKGIHRIQANMDARNLSSAKLCEKIGMRKEAHFIKDFWNKNEWTDSFIYGMLISDLKSYN
ncbi:GNAT family N-acetyltransferase [Aliarcobacter butzleri]|uniref:GNAT family N-acetyltransferase n=1 Tax=Aliarcobacter butzleri TaxID=28197 RepID=UPI001EDD4F32|nr:GNAT family N-acetyltransferase [Aliarcobacter butzleri]MCG3669003.1 GNAT family N-acetyltransferase [Aliarcobacter butzleri]